MDSLTLFKNIVNYDTKEITKSNVCNSHTINLSSLLYFVKYNEINSELFNIERILDLTRAIYIHNDENEHKILIQPDILKLSQYFENKLSERTFSNFQDAFNYFTKTKKTLEKLFYEIYDFFLIREENLNYKYLENLSPFTKEQNDEILNVLIAFSNILPHKTLFINNDYVYVKNELIKQNYSINVPHIHNYKSLASFIEETVKKENDYYDYFEGNNNFLNNLNRFQKEYEEDKSNINKKILYEVNQERYDLILENIDIINSSPSFTKENFSILYVYLNQYVEQEKAIDEFIEKILTDKIETKIISI